MIDKWNHGAIVIDFETRSEIDLRKTNPYVYSCHDSTTALCCAFKILAITNEGHLFEYPTRLWIEDDIFCPDDLEQAIERGFLVWAHNVFFERCILENVMVPKFGWPKIDPRNYRCSAAQCAAYSMPRSLFGVCQALRLTNQKDDTGHRVMMQLCKPRKPTKNNPDRWFTKERYPEKFDQLYSYCVNDVNAEYEVIQTLPYLNATEFKIWQLDQEINQRGIQCDIETVETIISLFGEMQEKANRQIKKLTKGKVKTTNQVAAITKFCGLDSLSAQSVETALAGKLPKRIRRILELRQLMSKASVRKYQAMSNLASDDGRIRSHLIYHGARTGRWTGSGIQPQNMPRGNIKSTSDRDWCIKQIRKRDIEALELVFNSATDVFSSLVRSMLMAGKGKTLIAGDFASIEARILFWLARDKTALDIFRAVDKDPENNPDIYMVQAGSIYGIDPMKAYKGSEERYLGKKSILGLGYGMGWRKFQSTVFDESGIELDNLFAKRVVDKYRKRWKSVPRLWKQFESAAIKAVMDRVSVRVNNYVKYECKGPFLYCILPSGRKLAYYKPHIIEDLDPWDNETYKLAYYGTNSQSYKWERIHTYGGKLAENAVQAIARDLMAYAMLRLERSNYRIVLTVHDEIVCEVPRTIGSDEIFRDIMSIVPKWAKGCPIECESWIGKRYRK